MATDVKLKFTASGLEELMAAVDKLQTKAKSIGTSMKGGDLGRGPSGTPGLQTFQRTQQEASSQIASRRSEQIALGAVNGLLKEKERLLNSSLKLEAALTKQGKDATLQLEAQKKLLNDINVLEKQKQILGREEDKRKVDSVRGYKEIFSSLQREFQAGGIGGVKNALGGLSGAEKAGLGGTALGGILGLAGAAANYVGRRPIDIAALQSSAISQTTGRQLSEARTGEYTYQSMYGGDRAKAQEQAKSSNTAQTIGDYVKVGASAAALIAAIAGTGGLAGIPALAVGGAGALGLADGLFGKGIADPSKYAAYRAQREATDFTSLLASSQESGPYRKDAIERFRATGSRDIGMQRTLGLNDKGYYGSAGYLQGQMDLGFTDEMVTGASQGILGAGGSSAMGRNSGMALQAERGLGVTNATSLLGQLSGTQSIPETSKKSLIDIFSRGFDNSHYAEENRKYMQAVTEQVYKGGSTSESTASSIADMIRSTISGAPTTRNIEAGKSAFDAFSRSTSSLSGYMGGINVTAAMQDSDLAGIKDPAEFSGLLSMPYESISETDRAIVDSASRMNITPKALANKLRKLKLSNANTALNRDKNAPIAARRYMAQTTAGMTDVQAQQGYLDMLDQESNVPDDIASDRNAVNAANKKSAAAAMASKETGLAGDTAIQASAKNAQISLETLSQSISKFASDAMAAADKLSKEAPAGRVSEAAKAAVANAWYNAKGGVDDPSRAAAHSADLKLNQQGN